MPSLGEDSLEELVQLVYLFRVGEQLQHKGFTVLFLGVLLEFVEDLDGGEVDPLPELLGDLGVGADELGEGGFKLGSVLLAEHVEGQVAVQDLHDHVSGLGEFVGRELLPDIPHQLLLHISELAIVLVGGHLPHFHLHRVLIQQSLCYLVALVCCLFPSRLNTDDVVLGVEGSGQRVQVGVEEDGEETVLEAPVDGGVVDVAKDYFEREFLSEELYIQVVPPCAETGVEHQEFLD